MNRKTPSTKCSECGKTVRILPYKGDWLNSIYPVRHYKENSSICDGSFRECKDAEIIWPESDDVHPAFRAKKKRAPLTKP